jgi:hypothetical protein
MISIFQLMQQMLDTSILAELEQGHRVFHWYAVGKPMAEGIFACLVIVSLRHFQQAHCADHILPFNKRIVAAQTVFGKEKGNKIAENIVTTNICHFGISLQTTVNEDNTK